MKRILAALCAFSFLASPIFGADEYHYDRSRQPLLPRDSWGILHNTPVLNEPDYAPHAPWRVFYYLRSRNGLSRDVAYVGALQEALQRNGFYCGPIDGVFSEDVTEAIAHLQKSYGLRVNGALTPSVRRALFLP